jgi:hypothetical protein
MMIKNLLFAIFLICVSTVAVSAQLNPEQSVINARDQFFDIKNRSIEMERMKREVDKQPVRENFKLKFPEIKEDFEQIQKINAEVIQINAVDTPLNYTAISNLVAEINHRANRLRSNLFSAVSKTKKEANNKQQIVETQNIKKLINALDKAINSFVHNAIFKNVNVVDPDDSLKAQKDLELAINLSNAIKQKTKN